MRKRSLQALKREVSSGVAVETASATEKERRSSRRISSSLSGSLARTETGMAKYWMLKVPTSLSNCWTTSVTVTVTASRFTGTYSVLKAE